MRCVSGPGKRKTLRSAEYPRMEKKLHSWLVNLRNRHVPVSEELLAAKAKQFYVKYYGRDNFNASRGWISNFRKRYGIRQLKICGEKLSGDQTNVQPFIEQLDQTIKDLALQPSQIYNADESGLFWKMLPDKTLVTSKEKTAPGRKTSKERLTFLTCCNSDGSHRLRLLVIGKAKNPRAFKNAVLPVDYKATAKAWMTGVVFKQWFEQCFIPQVRKFLREKNLPEKALLLLDNASSHCDEQELISDDGNFQVKFLPPNTTALIQPMDHNPIRLTKLFYRKSLLAEILTNNEKDLVKCLKGLNLKMAVCLLHNAWQKIPSKTLEKSWKKILKTNNTLEEDDPEYTIPLNILRDRIRSTAENIDEVSAMLLDIGNVEVNTGEVLDWIDDDAKLVETEGFDDQDDNNSEEDIDSLETETTFKVKNEEAIKSFNTCLQWAEENEIPLADIMMLQKLKEIAFDNKLHKEKQAKITNFFQPV